MTSPNGSEHVSRYRALGEFDSLVRAAREAKRAIKELREEEVKLNSQSLADDKKVVASKQQRARAENDSATAVKRALADMARNKQDAAKAGTDNADAYVSAFGRKVASLNSTLAKIEFDPLDLDVDIEDAKQEIEALKFELTRLANTTSEVEVRVNANRALADIKSISRSLKDELNDKVVKDAERVHKELLKIDALPSGKSFRFWALTALADMSRVFEEADRGTGVFQRLRQAATSAGGGGGGNFLRSFIAGFDGFSESSSRLLQRLGRVSGELYRMPGIIATLVSALPALIAGVGALAGGAGALASGIGASLGVMAAGPGIIAAFGGAIGALTMSLSGFEDIFKAAKKAQLEQAEAQEKARLGTDKALTATQKYNLMLAQLDPATRKVTDAVVKFADGWAKTSTVVAENFFKQVADQTGRLNQILPIAQNYFGQSATALGKVADQGIRMITSGPWKRDFAIIAKNNAGVIEDMGMAGLSLANVFRNVAVAAGPFTGWLTEGIKDGARAFADWSAQARSDGTIQRFLMETRESLRGLGVILRNVGSVVNSFFQTTVDEGQRYLNVLGNITGRWADVAKAQQAANSPLRRWLTDIRPLLAAMGALIGDLVRGIASIGSNQSNITTMIDLLNILRTQVLPPILDILQQLNDSGIAVTVATALGTMLKAISDFLDSGAATGLAVFVTVLAEFFELVLSFAGLPVISELIGGLAIAIGTLAAVSIVARFTGLFKLWDFFTWMTRNRGNLSGAFTDAARGVAGLSNVGAGTQQRDLMVAPSTVNYRGIGSDVLEAQARATEAVGRASATASTQTGIFARTLRGVQSAGSTARSALSNLTGFLGGPWGIALVAATVLIGTVSSKLSQNKQEAQDTRTAFLALKDAYGELSQGNSDQINQLAQTDEKLRGIVQSAQNYGLTLRNVSGALNNNEQDLSRVNAQLDAQIAQLKATEAAQTDAAAATSQYGGQLDAVQYSDAVRKAEAYKKEINDVARAQGATSRALEAASSVSLTYRERLAGLTQAQVDNAVAAGQVNSRITRLSSALDTLSSSTATSESRSKALSDIIDDETGAMIRANEATENWNTRILDLRDALRSNGTSLSNHTRAGLRNRDALQEAAKATRDLYLQDIASGRPMNEATKRHQDRIRELQREADKAKLSKTETRRLIEAYGDVPDDVKTNISTKGYVKVYQEMQDLKALQASLQSGKSLSEATREVEQAKARANMIPLGDGYGAPGFKSGGPVWGAGTRTSDSIRAWLSNGEFVQPTDAVEYYGMPIMEALRTRKLDKAALNEALPDDSGVNFSSGGSAHSNNCAACSSGGHKFATGGSASWPFPVDASSAMVKKSWTNVGVGLGQGTGSGGVAWMMAALRKQFPGLRLISGYRPGSTTLSGNRSYHSLNRAVDLDPRRDVAAWIRSNYGARSKELITPFQDLNLHNGKPHRYTGAVWNQHNFAGGNAHNHWAYNKGGLVDLMSMMGMNNLAPQTSAPLPTTPRTLSPAASNVVNNTSDNGTTFGDIIINNPSPERGGDSIRNALYRTQLLL